MTHGRTRQRATVIAVAACLASAFALDAEAQPSTSVEAGINSSTNPGINITPGINTGIGAASPLPGATTTSESGATTPTATSPSATPAPAETQVCTSATATTDSCALGTGSPTNAIGTPPETDYPLYPWEDGLPPGP